MPNILTVERGTGRRPGIAQGDTLDLTTWDYRVALGADYAVLGFRAPGGGMFYAVDATGDPIKVVPLPAGLHAVAEHLGEEYLAVMAEAFELAADACARDNAQIAAFGEMEARNG